MTRLPARFANYPGDTRGSLTAHWYVGPNTTNEFLHPVTEDYDPATHTTRVGFAYGLPAITPDLQAEYETRRRIRALFVAGAP